MVSKVCPCLNILTGYHQNIVLLSIRKDFCKYHASIERKLRPHKNCKYDPEDDDDGGGGGGDDKDNKVDRKTTL